MKIEQLNKPDNTFKPFSIIFTFETQAELDAWGGIFNAGAFCDAMDTLSGGKNHRIHDVWEVLKAAGADLDSPTALRAFKTFRGIKIPNT